ncbi:molybdopterin cofactor-binding domain-containing protein [Nocardioides donggukensis]|uniref:Xanthine dehydrogenase family protein molybdopterin-binding subunit n=1 Tax=Nocardioides donggukensis TaxID=2774019 RepID=A0A927K2I5_9ACTN|nr:molybdopterin cofactor-binding domain-containing protein [Nocardioides donggukensis]MBD8868278.1 xanthine dehydrogenase family protein molybdopterin-binding subunit [Nocardioides donggukensis]
MAAIPRHDQQDQPDQTLGGHDRPDPVGPLPTGGPHSVGRRRFLGYVLGGATLMAAADLGMLAEPAAAAVPTLPQPAELYDLNDALTDSCRPTANLITVTVNEDGTASFALPRSENGQGVTTSTAMIIAEELDLPLSKVEVTLAPARPELLLNQLTGASNTTISTYTPIRVAAAIAKMALLEAAAIQLGDTVELLKSKDGVITAPDGSSVTYGELATKAASLVDREVEVELKSTDEFTVVGTPRNRVDALAAVTGAKEFATDLDVPGALPTMLCRPPTLNGTPKRVLNQQQVEGMPGVRNVALVDTGVAVRALTFGQCIDAVRALDVEWNDGPVAGMDDEDILANLRKAEVPLPSLGLNPLAKTIEADFAFYFRSNSPMDTNSAVADVRSDRATVWAGLKSPIVAQQRIAEALGMAEGQVTVNVVQGGGSFGRRLFFDGALEAAKVSQAMGEPVKLMWHRADDARAGRTHPMCTSRIRATYLAGQVLSFQQSHTSVETDYRHGLGEVLTARAADLPAGLGNQGFAQTVFGLTQEIPYDFGVVTQTLVEADERFNTGSMRNIYSPDVRVAAELVIDQLAAAMRKDPYRFRQEFIRNERVRAVLDKVATVGNWGRSMPAGTAQGIAIHKEYKGASACLVELDARPGTVDRDIRDAVTGPRVTKVVFAIDVGLAINPRGLEAQMQGGINDGIALALTSSLHLRDGHFLEGSWDNYFYTRQWNTPPEVEVIVMPSESGQPGGAGEAGVAAANAAVACAFARATRTNPTYFPINHKDPLAFTPKPFSPPIPQSPVNGLRFTY